MGDITTVILLVVFYSIAVLMVVVGFVKFDKAWKEDLEDLDEKQKDKKLSKK